MGGLIPYTIPSSSAIPPEGIAPAEWDDVYRRAEAFLNALGVVRRFQLHNEVLRILGNVAHGHSLGGLTPADAVLEIEREVDSWFREVMGNGGNASENMSARGKLALLRCGAFDLWPDAVMSRPPKPDEFVAMMRGSSLSSMPPVRDGRVQGPDLDLGEFPRLAEDTLWWLDRVRRIRALLVFALVAALLALLFYFAR
jgi:hypothetical protein